MNDPFDKENPMFRKGIYKRVTIYGIVTCMLVLIILFIFLLNSPRTRMEKEAAVFVGFFVTFILSYHVFTLITLILKRK
jgi:magnesium-transporting ATPase (P-type)